MPDNSSPTLPLFVGVDVGGTNIKIGVVDDNGDRLAYTKFPTQADQPPEGSIERIESVVQELLDGAGLKKEDVAAVGLGTPGPYGHRARHDTDAVQYAGLAQFCHS